MFRHCGRHLSRVLAAAAASCSRAEAQITSSVTLHALPTQCLNREQRHESGWTRCFSVSPTVLGFDGSGLSKVGTEAVINNPLLDPEMVVKVAAAADHTTVVVEASQRWLTIAATTVVFRLVTLPVAMYQVKNTYRMSQARPESELLVNEYQTKIASGMDASEARNWYTNELAAIWKKYDCNPMKSFSTLAVNGTLFISFFMALRGLSDARVPSMTYGGLAWFPDLTIADPHYGLPLLSAAVFLGTIELGAADGMQGQPEKMMNRMKWLMRGLAIGIVPFTLYLPSSVFIYWITSNIFSLAQTKVLRNPKVKRFIGLPDLEIKKHALEDVVGKPVKTYQYNPTKLKKRKTLEI